MATVSTESQPTGDQVQQRKIAAIVGACVGDAASQPVHWVYSELVLSKIAEEDIAFKAHSVNPFYRIATGRNTCYGDQAYVVLKSLVECKGLNVEHLKNATYKFFGPDSDYEVKDADRGRPISGPWRNSCVREFLHNFQAGQISPASPTDDQIDCAVRIIPLVALYAGHPEMLNFVEEGLKVLQESDLSVVTGLAFARVLEQYILKGDPGNVLETVITALSDRNRKNPQDLDLALVGQLRHVNEFKDVPHLEAMKKAFQKAWHLPGALQSALHGVVSAPNYADGIRSTIRAGGCNASRSGIIGACVGAKGGLDSIPAVWKKKTFKYEEVLNLAQKLVQITI